MVAPHDYRLALASELLEDIELSRLPAEKIALKAFRLARALDDTRNMEWLRRELFNYQNEDKDHVYIGYTNRWIDKEKGQAYWAGIGQIEALIESQEARLAQLRVPDIQSEYAAVALREITSSIAQVSTVVGRLRGIRSRVLALIHGFVSNAYYELTFSGQQQDVFEGAQAQVDALLGPLGARTLERIESINRRLNEGDDEAVSQALSTCRRLVDAFADAVFPAREDPEIVDGQPVALGPGHHQNRINAYVRQHTESQSRRKRLRRRLGDLYERVSTGVHSDVSIAEARFLFLDTYLLLGEIAVLGNQSTDQETSSGPPTQEMSDSSQVVPQVDGHASPMEPSTGID